MSLITSLNGFASMPNSKKKKNITKFRMRVQLIGLIKSKQRGITGELDGDRWWIWNGLQERRVRSICSQGQRVNFD